MTTTLARQYGRGPIWAVRAEGLFYFRVFGWGLRFTGSRPGHASFAERNGYERAWHVAGLCIRGLSR